MSRVTAPTPSGSFVNVDRRAVNTVLPTLRMRCFEMRAPMGSPLAQALVMLEASVGVEETWWREEELDNRQGEKA